MTYYSIHPRSIKWWVDQKKEWISLNHTFVFVILVWSYFKRPHIHISDSIGKFHDQYDRWSWWLGVDRIMKDWKKVEFRHKFCFRTITLFQEYFAWSENERFKKWFQSRIDDEKWASHTFQTIIMSNISTMSSYRSVSIRMSFISEIFQSRGYNFWSLKYYRNIVKTFVTMKSQIVILAKPVRGKSLVKMNFVIIFVFEIHWKIDKIISLCHLKTIVFCHDHYVLDIVRR